MRTGDLEGRVQVVVDTTHVAQVAEVRDARDILDPALLGILFLAVAPRALEGTLERIRNDGRRKVVVYIVGTNEVSYVARVLVRAVVVLAVEQAPAQVADLTIGLLKQRRHQHAGDVDALEGVAVAVAGLADAEGDVHDLAYKVT